MKTFNGGTLILWFARPAYLVMMMEGETQTTATAVASSVEIAEIATTAVYQ